MLAINPNVKFYVHLPQDGGMYPGDPVPGDGGLLTGTLAPRRASWREDVLGAPRPQETHRLWLALGEAETPAAGIGDTLYVVQACQEGCWVNLRVPSRYDVLGVYAEPGSGFYRYDLVAR